MYLVIAAARICATFFFVNLACWYDCLLLLLLLLLAYYSRRRQSREYSVDQPLWFCLSVRTNDKTKTAESKIAKLGTEIVHHDISPTNDIRSKVKSQG